MRSRSRGFTIIELMVAMALMVILTGLIVYIFGKSRDIVLFTEAQAEVFQQARYSVDLLARDIGSIIKTIDMEPFKDTEDPQTRMRNRHYDVRETRYKALGGPKEDRYDYSLTLHEGFYEDKKLGDDLMHSADSLYLKTIAMDKGTPREAFVTWYLVDTDQERPILKRRFEWFDRQKLEMKPSPAREEDVCYFVTDFRVEFFYVDNRDSPQKRRGPGMWLTPLEAQRRGIVDPDRDPATFVFNYHYNEQAKDQIDPNASGRGRLIVDAGRGYEATFTTEKSFSFPQLVPGDTIFLFGMRQKRPSGQIPWLVDQELTIAEISPATKQIFFLERVIIESASNNEPPPPILNISYRAAYLPSAFRITLRIKDHRADAIRTIQRVFRVLGG